MMNDSTECWALRPQQENVLPMSKALGLFKASRLASERWLVADKIWSEGADATALEFLETSFVFKGKTNRQMNKQ